MIRDIIDTFKLAGDLAAGCPAGRTSFVRSRVGDPSAFGVGIPSALTHSLGSPLGASLLLGNPPRLAGSIISLIIRQSPRNVPFDFSQFNLYQGCGRFYDTVCSICQYLRYFHYFLSINFLTLGIKQQTLHFYNSKLDVAVSLSIGIFNHFTG